MPLTATVHIKERLKELDKGSNEAAREMGLQPSELSRYACGWMMPSVLRALAIAEALDSRVETLWRLEE